MFILCQKLVIFCLYIEINGHIVSKKIHETSLN